jgi:DNA replication ATP-dependent helicase Dna2
MPGTGKTSTLALLVSCFLARGETVLISSFTHTAVDTLVLKCLEFGSVPLRIGQASSVHPLIAPFCLEERIKREGIASVEAVSNLISSARFVAVSAMGIQHALFDSSRRPLFDVCILDEAGQIPEPIAVGPLRLAKRFVLVGDPLQLPPLVKSTVAKNKGYDVSLLKRLSERHPHSVTKLVTQYRMNDSIQSLSNSLVYSNQLECGSSGVANSRYILPKLDSVSAEKVPNWVLKALHPEVRVLFVDLDGFRFENSRGCKPFVEEGSNSTTSQRAKTSSYENENEADAISLLVQGLILAGGKYSDVGIISPYRSQLAMIRRRICDTCPVDEERELEIDTVDRFQGRDKNVIVLSTVQTDENALEHSSGSILSDIRRLNVAITRPKKKLLIIGSRKKLLRSNDDLRRLLEVIIAMDWYLAAGESCN